MNHKRFLPLALAGLLPSSLAVAAAHGEVNASSQVVNAGPAGPLAQGADGSTLSALRELEAARASLPDAFAEAYAAHPSLPEGILEAVAWSASRWVHRIPEAAVGGHHGIPQTYGVMGLHHGAGGLADQVGAAARALGVSEAEVIADPRINILATAALLDQLATARGLSAPTAEALVPALRDLSGLPSGGRVAAYAQDAYAFDVLLALDRGVDGFGVDVPEIPIQWARAFDPAALARLNAPRLRVDVDQDLVLLEDGSAVNPAILDLQPGAGRASLPEVATTTDYPPADWVASPNYSSRGGTAITHVVIHTVEGSYASCISWFQNTSSQVSAHYVVRSSDGQVTQMVREADKAWHVGSENPYTIGIEHEGYVSNPSYLTSALYDSSAALTRDICASNGIDCGTCYDGPSSASVQTLSSAYHVKGHQHYPNQNHTDPGQYWDWPRYADAVADDDPGPGPGGGWGGNLPGGGGGALFRKVLDDFEGGEGHFNLAPTYSGSTTGISTSSTADHSTAEVHGGAGSERLVLVDGSGAGDWQVRFLSGGGSPAANVAMSATSGSVGLWVYTDASGLSVAPLIDDSDGLEVGARKTVPAGRWTQLKWPLADAASWDSYYAGNGALDAASVTLDALMLYHAESTSSVTVYIDDVGWTRR